jgi:hypothetical protein
MYAFDALEGIRRSTSRPERAPFTPWINIYNPADHLSFAAAPVFPGVEGIEDRVVSGRDRFPHSHSAYWTNQVTWDSVGDGLDIAVARSTTIPQGQRPDDASERAMRRWKLIAGILLIGSAILWIFTLIGALG